MSRTGVRRNYFIRAGRLVMLEPVGKSVAMDSVSGKFEGIREQSTRRRKGNTHWLVLELDKDEYGPTKGIYFNAEDFAQASGIVSIARAGVTLKVGDEISIRVRKDGHALLEVNGISVQPDPEKDLALYRRQAGEFVDLLDGIRGGHLEKDVFDHVESEYFFKVRDLVREHIAFVDEEHLRDLVLSVFLPAMEPGSSFEDIYPAMKRLFTDAEGAEGVIK